MDERMVTYLGDDLVKELDVERVLLLGDSLARAVYTTFPSVIQPDPLVTVKVYTHSPALAWKTILLVSMSSLGSP